MEYCTEEGSSRQKCGIDFDVIDGVKIRYGDVLLTKKFHGKGPYVVMRKWMEKNAATYGFIRPYTDKKTRKGFYYEPWHYSYAPKSIPMLKQYLELDHRKFIFSADLKGGDDLDQEFLESYIKSHVMGIDPSFL